MNKNFPIETRYNTLKKYSENYENDLKAYLDSYEDNSEIDFLEKELFSHKEYLKHLLTKTPETNDFDEGVTNQRKINSQKRIIAFIETKIANINNQKLTIAIPKIENTLNWIGDQTAFIELAKALIENGNFKVNKGEQGKTIDKLAQLLNITIKNRDKLISDIKNRNNGSETLFLNELQKTLFNYITSERTKNTRK